MISDVVPIRLWTLASQTEAVTGLPDETGCFL